MKTPEEIKKGLECCKSNPTCSLCPYYNEDDCQVMEADALAYIQQLERERDVAVEDIECGMCCETCAHYDTPASDPPCVTCSKSYTAHGNWQWRGAQ